MTSTTSSVHQQTQLLAEITCPNCWQRCRPDELLFIARHESLIGDPVAGASAYRRFRPSRFDVHGDALDARNIACQQLACPRCHLEISRALLELSPFFLSIVGAPASGKSYFLTAMTWQMRGLASRLGLAFADGDPTANAELQRYEETLFMSAQPDTPIALRKTEIQGSALYQSIYLDGQTQTFPRPFLFTLAHQHRGPASQGPRAIAPVLYDNAGEHFLPGQDAAAAPVTLHLSRSAAICFVFDPTQDPRFRNRCGSKDPQLEHGIRPGAGPVTGRQEIILNEMITRIRRHRGLSESAKHNRPLIIILAKADLWLPDNILDLEPLDDCEPARLRVDRVTHASKVCRELMRETCPEVVNAAEHFSPRVTYIPVSSLGCSPELVERGEARFYGIRPRRIKPKWATVPLLWAMAQTTRGMIPTTGSGSGAKS